MLVVDQLKKSDTRLRVLALGVLGGLLLLAGGLWFHQVIASRRYVERLNSQSFRTIRVPAIRGKILDRNGIVLAENRASYNVNLYLNDLRPSFRKKYDDLLQRQLAAGAVSPGAKTPAVRLSTQQQNELNLAARYLAVDDIVKQVSRLTGEPLQLDAAKLATHYEKRRALPMTLTAGLSMEQIAVFQEKSVAAPGLALETQAVRYYPRKSVAAHVLGFLQRDDSSGEDEDTDFNYRLPDFRGQVGIEAAFDDPLRGVAGRRALLVNNFGYRQGEFNWGEPEPGRNIVLTLDAALQADVERALAGNGANTRGSAIVMDANNGDVFALASAPTYDLNQSVGGFSTGVWEQLSDEHLKPMLNRAVKATYSPGSTFKIITGLAALEAGLDPKEIFHGEGRYVVTGHTIKDTAGAGDFNFKKAFIKSSNAYFVHQGLRVGLERITELGARLHLGEPTKLPLYSESAGLLPTPAYYKRRSGGHAPGDVANVSIGQGELSVTPMQMAVMTAAIANGGKVFWPRIVERIEPQEDQVQQRPQLLPAGRLRDELHVSQRSLDIMRDAMYGDVEDPEASAYRAFHPNGRAALPGVRIGGKTGTAQVQDTHNHVTDWNTWFVSFAPMEKHVYVVTVMIESGGSGGTTCAPIARQIYEAIQKFEQRPVRPRGGQLAEVGR
ncbi:MAG: hypothetical protein HY301_02380 [Verrucomicrobia bacterium]|nr:hypothetical protein [Verrucomicrobiota bacterium]